MVDKIDRKILNELQDNGKITVAELSKKINVPMSTIFKRMRKLEKSKIVKGYTAIVDPDKVDKSFTAFFFIRTKDTDFNKVGKEFSTISEVQEVHFTIGEEDFILKARVKDKEEYVKLSQKIFEKFGPNGKGIFVAKSFKDSLKLNL